MIGRKHVFFIEDYTATYRFSNESVANSSVVVLARTDDSFSDGQSFIASAT